MVPFFVSANELLSALSMKGAPGKLESLHRRRPGQLRDGSLFLNRKLRGVFDAVEREEIDTWAAGLFHRGAPMSTPRRPGKDLLYPFFVRFQTGALGAATWLASSECRPRRCGEGKATSCVTKKQTRFSKQAGGDNSGLNSATFSAAPDSHHQHSSSILICRQQSMCGW